MMEKYAVAEEDTVESKAITLSKTAGIPISKAREISAGEHNDATVSDKNRE